MLLVPLVYTATVDEEVAELMKAGKHLQCIRILEQLRESERQEGSRLINLARSYALEGDLVRSESILRENIRVHGTKSEGYVSLGKLLIHLQRLPEAVTVLRQGETNAIDLREDASLFVILGKALANSPEEQGDLMRKEEALRYAMKAEEIGSSDAIIMYELGMLLFFLAPPREYAPKEALQIHTRGRSALERSRLLNPTLDRRFVGKVFSSYQRYAWAAEEFKAHLAEADNSSSDVEVLVLLAECEERLNNPKKAEQLYRLALSAGPSDPSVLVALGKLLLGLGYNNYAALEACGIRAEEALGYLRRAVSLLDTTATPSSDLQTRYVYESASEIIAFCHKEHMEVAQWKKVADDLIMRGSEGEGAWGVSEAKEAGLPLREMARTFRLWVQRATRTLRLILGISGTPMTHARAHADSRCAPSSTSTSPQEQGRDRKGSERTDIDIDLQRRVLNMRDKWHQRTQKVPHVERKQVRSPIELLSIVTGGVPVVITNLQTHWPTHQHQDQDRGAGGRRSSVRDALLSHFSNHTVRVSVSASDRFDGPEDGSLWGLAPGTEVLVRPPTTSMRLADFFSLSERRKERESGKGKGKRRGSETYEGERETFYIEYLSLQQYLGPSFIDTMVPLPPELEPLLIPGSRAHEITTGNKNNINNSNTASFATPEEEAPLSFLVSNLWVSSGTTTISPLHYDDYENLLFQIEGEKEFLLFSPHDYPNLYYQGRPKGKLRYDFPATFTRDPGTLDKRSFVFASSVNVDEPDYSKHPRYLEARPVRAHLEAGDALFVPAFWHHEVQSLPSSHPAGPDGAGTEGGGGGINMAINVWCANISWPGVDGML